MIGVEGTGGDDGLVRCGDLEIVVAGFLGGAVVGEVFRVRGDLDPTVVSGCTAVVKDAALLPAESVSSGWMSCVARV